MTHEQEARELLASAIDCNVEIETGEHYVERRNSIAAVSEALRQRDEARASLVYKGDYDTDDEHTEAILAAHPIKSGDWAHWNAALEMVSNRKSKGSLVMLANWLLKGRNEVTAQRDKAQARIDELLCLQAEERVFARTAISDAKDDAERFKSQRDKAVEALRPYKRLAEIVEKALVEDGPPARMKLKSGEIITGEPAEIFESLALTVLEVGKQAAAVVKEIDGK